jgi:endo-1,4-beta-xylanase
MRIDLHLMIKNYNLDNMKKNYLLLFLFLIACSSDDNGDSYDEPVTPEIGLKDIAVEKGKFIGNLMRDGFFDNYEIYNGAIDNILKTEYNALVTGNKLKMANILRDRPEDPFNIKISDLNTYNIDRFVDYANKHNMKKRGHVMVWYKQIPNWLEEESVNWSSQQIYSFTESYIRALSKYTVGKIDEWDVLNEAIVFNGYRTNTWYEKVNSEENDNGEIGYLTFFSKLFKWAREENADVKLFYNDYGIEEYGTPKNNLMRIMVKDLKTQLNTPIDGVGLQSHFKLENMNSSFMENLGNTIDDLGNSGFIANLTELDIRICDGISQGIQEQKDAYKQIVLTAFSKPNCNTILIWGSSDIDSWIPSHFSNCGQATPHDENFEKKPAYFGIKEALQEL